MTDQNTQFMAILTAVGEAKQANANALGIPWILTQMAVGDANGTEPTPDRLQTSLINERRRAPLNQLNVDPDNEAIIIAEQVIPENVGGWWIREIGLYDEDGDLVAIANCPPTFKPELSQGSGRTQVVRLNIQVSSTDNIQLKIDPSVVLATRSYVDSLTVRASQEDAELGEDNSRVMTPLTTHQAIYSTLGDLGQNVETFASPGVYNWIVPNILKNGKRKARVTVIGAGGGGGNMTGAVTAGGGGGGGGAGVKIIDLTGVETVPITVGSGGSGAPSGISSSGTAGGSSSFGSYLSCGGGDAGSTPSSGGAGSSVGADVILPVAASTPAASFSSNAVGGSGGGFGGSGIVTTSSGVGKNGAGPGGGGAGGGGVGASGGGRGADGFVAIEW